jgi:ATP-dependent Clp protease ATP-binding subunit ClpA
VATLETYRERFAESGWQIFERGLAEASGRGQNYLGVEHILYALVQEKAELFSSLLRSLFDNPEAVELLVELIEERVEAAAKHEGGGLRLSTVAIELFKRTLKRIRAEGRQRIEATDLFFTLLMDEKSLLRLLIRRLLSDPRAEAKEWRSFSGLAESVGAGHRTSARPKYQYSAGERVRIKTGPFAAFTGQVEEVYEDKFTLKVKVHIMGREQPIELGFLDVERIDFTG